MDNLQKTLTDQLIAAVIPINGDATPSKAVAKTLKQLAKQLAKQQNKQAKAAQQPTSPTAKRARKILSGELATALQPYVGVAEGAEVPKNVAKAVKRLATQLVKVRRKRAKQEQHDAKQTAKAAHTALKNDTATPPKAQSPRKPATRPSASPPVRRSAATAKQATPQATAPTLSEEDNG